MAEQYKEIMLSGEALQNPYKGGRRRGTRKSKKGQDGGDNSGALLQLASQSAPANHMQPETQALARDAASAVSQAMAQLGPSAAQRGGDGIAGAIQLSASRTNTQPGAPAPTPVVSGLKPEQPAPVAGGGVVLKPPKRKSRIALKAPKLKHHHASTTQKAPRKFHLRSRGVTARLAKAKKAAKQAGTAPISEIKTRLESAGIIKKGSKAPEPMLRSMYADLLITKKGL